MDQARLDIHLWAMALKLFPNPYGAKNEKPVDPPQLTGSPGEPEDSDAEDHLKELLANADT